MLPIPSLPTESLYKFLSIGGIIAILTSTALFVTQMQKTQIANIQYATATKRYLLKTEEYNNAYNKAKSQLKKDSIEYSTYSQVVNIGRDLVKKRWKEEAKDISISVDGKVFENEEKYNDYILEKYNEKIDSYKNSIELLRNINNKISDERISL